MLKHHPSLRVLFAALAVMAVTLASCGRDETVDEVLVPQAVVAAPSLESAPEASPVQEAAVASGQSDAPTAPQVDTSQTPGDRPDDVPEELKIIWESWQYLLDDYVDMEKLEPEAFSEEAIRGILRALGDREMSYVSPEVMSGSFEDVFRGDFEGIGAHVSMNRAGKVVIVSPIAGSPAEAAGIRSGDLILEVDGESIDGLSLLETVAKIRGPKGSIVALLVKHLTDLDPVLISVKRGVIPLVSVILRSEPGDRFAHIRLTDFYPNTTDRLKELIATAKADGAEGLILDLRNNPGGTLDAVVDVASQFLNQGLVLYSLGGHGHRTDWAVRSGGVAREIPMVVLVNQGSASSSEVLAGALQDHDRAVVIGSTTYGKGSVNILRRLSNGGGLYITTAHWYTPQGRLIQEDGLTPDIVVDDRDPQEADIKQLRRAIEELEVMLGEGKSAKPSP